MKSSFPYLPQVIYGGIDGLVTTLAVVAWSTGGWLSEQTVIILGIANVFADGLSMSIGAYLSTEKNSSQNINPYLVGVTTFISFFIFGFLPLLPYIFSFGSFGVSAGITGCAFIAIWYIKSIMNPGTLVSSIAQTVWLGSIAAAVAYYVGVFLGSLS